MEYISKEQVVNDFKNLLPWEKVDVLDEILHAMGENSIEDYLFKQGGYSPFDFTNASKCVDYYGEDTLMDEMDDYKIEEYIACNPSCISAYQLIETLKEKWELYGGIGISETNIKELNELLKKIKVTKKENV